MNTILGSFLYEWPKLYEVRNALIPHMSGYQEAKRELEQAERALEAALGEEERRLYVRYSNAVLTNVTIEADASLIAGASVTLRLLTALLTP